MGSMKADSASAPHLHAEGRRCRQNGRKLWLIASAGLRDRWKLRL